MRALNRNYRFEFFIRIREENSLFSLHVNHSFHRLIGKLYQIFKEVVTRMSKNEKEILKTFEKVIPDLTELEREKLLSFGEGIAFKTAEQKKQRQIEERRRGDRN